MALFKFNSDREIETVVEACNISQDLAEQIANKAEEVMNESLDMASRQESGPLLRVGTPVSLLEIAQACAEAVEELTPEIGFFIGIVAEYEVNNRQRHAMYLARKE